MLSRRGLLTAAAASAAFAGLARYAAAEDYTSEVAGYGPLRPDPAGLFDLPEGFAYTVVSRAGEPMSDGLLTPSKMDGMGCFPLDAERVVLIRNHELDLGDDGQGPFGAAQALAGRVDEGLAYDRDLQGRLLAGGTTSLVYDTRARRLEAAHLSLAGTLRNCAGGGTPWGSWLSCEEVVRSAAAASDRRGTRKSHGWVFEVPSGLRGLAEPRPLTGMGRFRHEAACVDPRSGVVYMTEDEGDGLFYRYLPEDRGALAKGGRLQALGFVDDRGQGDSRNWGRADWRPGQWREVVWVDLAGVDNPDGTLRLRGQARGAARFARGEGLFFGAGDLYFACTNGGPHRHGQIMRYRPSPEEGRPGERDRPGRLQLFVEPTDPKVMRMADNIAVAPWGHLFVCEDKFGLRAANYLRAITPEGKVYTIGRQAAGGSVGVGADSELAGVCFSPDGSTLFLNIYRPGVTLAVSGPWARLKV